VVAPSPFDSPLYDAGIARDDVLMSIDGRSFSSAGQLDEIIGDRSAGEQVRVTYSRRGELRTTRVTLAEDPRLAVVAQERRGQRLTAAQRQFRRDWLGSQIDN
jgi:predicted metalloprotease with PDZ domain